MTPKHFRPAILLALTTALSSQCVSAHPADSEPSPFRLDGTLGKLEGRPILRLKLTNRSSRPVEVKRRELPWNSDSLLQMIAVVESDQGMSLPFAESLGHIYDLSAAVLQPGESLEGKVELLHRFPTLLDMEHQRALLVFWSYDFGWSSPAPSQPAMGGIRISAKELEGFSRVD